jgi:hypothetical protein
MCGLFFVHALTLLGLFLFPSFIRFLEMIVLRRVEAQSLASKVLSFGK